MFIRYQQVSRIIGLVKPATIVEIGTWNGDHACIMAAAALKHRATVHYTGYDLFDAANAERLGDLARAAELKYGTIINLQKELEAETKKLADMQQEGAMLKEEVDAEDIAEVGEDVIHRHSTSGKSSVATHSLMSKLVVALALVCITEHFIGLSRFLEFLFCLLISGIPVGMEFHRQLAVAGFENIDSGALLALQGLVITPLHRLTLSPLRPSHLTGATATFPSMLRMEGKADRTS